MRLRLPRLHSPALPLASSSTSRVSMFPSRAAYLVAHAIADLFPLMYIATSPPAAPTKPRKNQSILHAHVPLPPFPHSTSLPITPTMHTHPPTYLASLEAPPIMPNAHPIRLFHSPLSGTSSIHLSVDQSNLNPSHPSLLHHTTPPINSQPSRLTRERKKTSYVDS
ncbi:hypothetical protein IWZ03DRAFT_364847 [Phyllosticta citriasiana]|uniref:Uncharacterized protein n=1 Tax=Phyllosticta citriasiana TaxID=595635 RepID=A0ABR1L1W1_9PEZI